MLPTFDPVLLVLECLLLLTGMTLAVLAHRRDWRPGVALILLTGLGLRLAMLTLAVVTDVRPPDLNIDFRAAGVNALEHRDPALHAVRDLGWNYLPTYALFLAANEWVCRTLDLSWMLVSRIGPIFFDLGVALLVGRLATRREAFQYACFPLPVLVSAVHGQMEPLCLLFAVGAFTVLHRPRLAGVLLALAISVKTWPALFIPALLFALPGRRERRRALAALFSVLVVLLVTMPLTVGTPVGRMPEVVKIMLGYSPAIGTWGWASALLSVAPDVDREVVSRIGTLLTLSAVLGAIWLWRRAHALDIAQVSASAFQVVTAGHGVQYLSWAGPFATVRQTRLFLVLQGVLGLYAAVGYLVLGLSKIETYRVWSDWYFLASLLVIPLIAAAQPWSRRGRPAAAPGPRRELAGSAA
jgi:hypothetical protein